MSKNTELLQFVHKNAEMGCGTIPKVLEMVEEPELRRTLNSQIAGEAEQAIRLRGGTPQSPGQISEAMSDLALKAKTMTNQSASHIAEMMIKGSTMGTVQMTKRIHDLKDKGDQEAVELAERLLKTEENNIQQLKSFL